MNKNNSLPPAALAGLAAFDRRTFLGSAIAAGTAVLSGCANLFGKKAEDPAAGLLDPEAAPAPQKVNADQGLTPEERAVYEKLVRVLLPVVGEGWVDTVTVPVMENIDNMVRHMPPFIRDRMNLAIQAFDSGAILLTYKFRRFSTLSDEDALAYINSWHKGTFVQQGAVTTLKVVVCVNYWRDQRAAAKIDYDGPVTEKWGIPRLGNQMLPRA